MIILTLPIKKKWFDKILSREKTEEYRKLNRYYSVRFTKLGVDNGSHHKIRFRNGYQRLSPTIECDVTIRIGYGNPHWGATPNERYFILKIFDVKEVV